MISLTRLSGSVFALNADLIERIDSTPDTVITLMDGKKYVVAEPLREVMDTILRQRAEIVALSGHIHVGELLLPRDPHDALHAQPALASLLDLQQARPTLSVVDAGYATATGGPDGEVTPR